MEKFKLKITFTESLLGSQPGSDTPARDFLQRRATERVGQEAVADEAQTFPENMDRGTTGFHRGEDGEPMIFNYHVKGALKEAASVLNGLGNNKNLRGKIESTVYVSPRRIKLHGEMGDPLERPLRAMTMQGPRTSLARSETMRPGTWFECEIELLNTPKFTPDENMLRKLVDHCKRLGFGQWRNSGVYGQYDYELTRI